MVYIVFLENGEVHSVHSSMLKADQTKRRLEEFYEKVVVKGFMVL